MLAWMMSFLKRDSQTGMERGAVPEVIDKLLNRLQNRLGCKPAPLEFEQEELKLLNKSARKILQQQSMLIEMEPPVKVVGDTHGQFYDLLRLFDLCGDPSDTPYIFLGDYVDRGQLALESLVLLFAFLIKYPDKFRLLRGNHECSHVNQMYGFYDECRKRFGRRRGMAVWEDFTRTFNYMPVAAIVGKRIFCVHGGLSPDLTDLDQIRQLPRPCEIPDYGLMCDLVWSDPDDEKDGWSENPRAISFTFGRTQIKQACQRFGVDLIVRAHQAFRQGYKFTANGRLLTIFSAPNYNPNHNSAAILNVNKNLVCSFEIMRPDESMPLIYRHESEKKSISL